MRNSAIIKKLLNNFNKKQEGTHFGYPKGTPSCFSDYSYKDAFLYTPALYLNVDKGIFTSLAASEALIFPVFHF